MPTLIGRDAAAAELRQLVDGLRAGEGRLALVAGEAGIGKTALAQELARYAGATGAAVAWGVGVDSVGVPAYWPWPDVIAALGAPPLPDASPGEDGWFAAGTAVVAALRSAATTEAPVVVVLDDLQWAGAGCVRILDLAARQLRRSPVLLLGTFRDDEVGPHHPLSTVVGTSHVVTVEGLGEADVASLLRESIGERADVMAGGVARRTGGNPFFVQQIARLLSSGVETRVPAAVGEAINRRLARLPERTSRLLDLAAVLGSDVDNALLAAAAGRPFAEVAGDLEPALAGRILRSQPELGWYRFEHDLYRETKYQDLAPARRAEAHRAVAEALMKRRTAGGDVRLADIAHHYAQAVPAVSAEQALDHVIAAADDAEERHAHEEEARHRAQAVRLAEIGAGDVRTDHGTGDLGADDGTGDLGADHGSGGVRADRTDDLRLALADALLRAGDVARARATYLAAADRQPARAALGVHRCGTPSGETHAQTIALLDRAVSVVDEPLGAQVRAALARELADGPDADVAKARDLAADAVRRTRAGGDEAYALALLAQHDVEWGPGTAAARLAISQRMAEAAAGQPDLAFEAALCRFVALVELGDPAAEAALRELEARARQAGRPHHRYLALSRRAAYTLAAGDVATGLALAHEARELADALGEPDGYGVHATQVMMAGQVDGGALGLARAMRGYAEPAFPEELAPHGRAVRQLADGRREAATATLRAVVGPEIQAMFRWRALAEGALVIEIAAAAGAADLCAIRYRNLLPYAGGFVVIGGVVAILGPVDLFLGLAAATTGDQVAARRHLRDAVTLADRFGALAFAARARVELARVLRTLGKADEAATLAREGAEGAARLGLDLATDHEGPEWRRTDRVWTLTFAGRTVRLPDAKGLHDLAALLAAPGHEISAVSLAGLPDPETGADEILDERARAAYKRRLDDLESELDSADPARALRLDQERDALIAELSRSYGLGGRPRRLGDQGERARSMVTNRIRDTLRRIERVHPDLAAHLRGSVTTGRQCVYRPDPPVSWVT